MEQNSELKNQNTTALPASVADSWGLGLYYFWKRVIDVLVSFFALIILSPVMLMIAILIHFDSPGSVLFTQKRVGCVRIKKNGRSYWEQTEFQFYKFRTMVDKCDTSVHQAFVTALINHDEQKIRALQESDEKVKKLANDKRITKLGHILRRSSLDELPQFWNVLRGEMSLIGPRPAISYEVDVYKTWYFRRFEAKPGMTGLWQVIARSNCDFDDMVRLDIEYIECQSFWLDLKIMVMTPLVVVQHRGAC